MQQLYTKIREKLNEAEKILIISHRKPDADTLGAAISLKIVLDKQAKKVKLACIDRPGAAFNFLPLIDQFETEFVLTDFDLIIIVDAGASYMTDFHLKYENLFKSDLSIINIDHHASNDNFGTINLVDASAASTTLILYRMFKDWGVEINDDTATCLLAGIYGDTGSFMHSNTSEEVLRVAADLMECGGHIGPVAKNLFKSTSLPTLKLWGKVLENTQITEDHVVVSVIKEEDYDMAGASPEELSGVVDYLNMIPDTKFAVLLNEDRKGNVKGSLRTREESIDLSRIAAVFGGGGHPKASGFSLPGKLQEEIRYTIVSDDMSKKSLEF